MRKRILGETVTPISGEWGSGDGEVKVLRSTNFTNEGHVDYTKIACREVEQDKVRRKRLAVGDVLIEKSGGSPTQPVGRVVYFESEGEFLTSNFLSALRVHDSEVHSKYLFYWLFSGYSHGLTKPFQNKTTGIINLQLKRFLQEIEFPLPPLVEQQRIAEILDEADRVRKKTQALIDKYDELAQSLFLDMFGDPVTNPKGWEVKPLGEICEFFGGKAWKKEELTSSGMRLVRISNLHIPNFKWWHYDGPFVEKYAVEQGDLLFSWAGVASSIDVYLYHGELAMLNQHIYNLKPAKEGFPKDYLFEFIRQLLPHLRNQMGGGVGQFYLKKSDIQGIQIFCAPTDILEQYRERARLIEAQKNEALAHYRFESSLFNALLQKAFKGELT